VSAEQIQSARVVDSAPLAPTRSSYVSATAKASNARPKVAFSQRPVVARLTPAVSRPAPQPTNRPGFQSFHNNDRSTAVSNHDTGPANAPPGGTADNNHRGASAPNGAVNNNGQQSQPASRDGFRPFTPPANAANNNANRGQTTDTVNHNQSMRYAPPAKARDEDYDVHPPLNQNQAQAKPEPKPEQKQERQPKKEEKKDDKDKDKK
jgi:hypothetical protein